MTSFGWLFDEDLSEVLSYICVRWHEKEPIAPADIKHVREATTDRTKLWTEEKLKKF